MCPPKGGEVRGDDQYEPDFDMREQQEPIRT